MADKQPILSVKDLSIRFTTPDGDIEAVKSLDFDVAPGECLGLVGESGSGKSQTVLATLGLTPQNGKVSGQAIFEGQDLLAMDRKALNAIRGSRISMIFQDPLTSLTPHMSIGDQMAETLKHHKGLRGDAADRVCMDWLERVRIPEARRRLDQFPHELSGGMRQRVMIASAMLCEPRVLLADEPTTALDVTVQAQVLALMDELKTEMDAGLVLITHDMGVVARMCDRVVVMRQGEALERADVNDIFARPQNDYTRMLLDAMPRLDRTDRGGRPELGPAPVPGTEPVLTARNVKVAFDVPVSGGLFEKTRPLRAVDGVSFDLRPGETLGVVGESGCGKSTLARAVLRLIPPTDGAVTWLGRDLTAASSGELRQQRKDLQIVFQDPLASLDPRMTIGQSIAEPFTVFRPDITRQERDVEVAAMMERVGLDPAMLNRYPHELSGGQNQRVGIARAMILKPKLVICDEAVSALDVSVQAQIIDLLIDLQKEFGLAMIFISHDLSVVKEISHRVMVLYLGRVVEMADRDTLFDKAAHPYTRALIDAVPRPDPDHERKRERIMLEGDLPSPMDPRASLRFMKSRMSDSDDQYRPLLVEVSPGHHVAEHDPMEGVSKGLLVN